MRVVGIDYGRRRIGLAVSDRSATIARPLRALACEGDPAASGVAVASVIRALADDPLEGDPIEDVVIGWPRRLSGDESALAGEVRVFAGALAAALGVTPGFQDERLSSHEADSRLRERDRDWRSRKAKLDAAAAAVILQDYLDERAAARERSSATAAGDAQAAGSRPSDS